VLRDCSFSFALAQKRKNQREKVKASRVKLLLQCSKLQAIELASLKQNRLLNAPIIVSVLRFTQEAGPFFFYSTLLHFASLVVSSSSSSLSASGSLCFARGSASH